MIRSMAMIRPLLVAVTILGLGCGPSQTGVAKPTPGGKDGKAVSITEAALPYKILRGRGGTEVDEATFMAELQAASLVCVGENHKNPHHHWAQLHLFDALSAHNQTSGRATALGMEMFQRPFQGVMDDYVAGRIDLDAMLSRTGYEDRWGFDWGFYGPTVELAIARKGAVLTLNTERELTKRIAKVGYGQLSEVERAKLPELNLENPAHRAWWAAIMGDMSHPKPEDASHSADPKDPHAKPEDKPDAKPEPKDEPKDEPEGKPEAKDKPEPEYKPEPDAKPEAKPAPPEEPVGRPNNRSEWIYSAQVLWDETMADGAVKWIRAGANRQVVLIAGNGHCHDSGIVGRVKRRGVVAAVSVRPIIDKGDGELAAHLASPENDFLFVMTLPTK